MTREHARSLPTGTDLTPAGERAAERGWRDDLIDIARAFLADAGPRAAGRTFILMLAAALTEGLTLALLAPLLALLTQSGGGRLRHVVDRMFALLRIADPPVQIATLMLFMVAMIAVRSFVIAARDTRLNDLQREFVDHLRSGLIQRIAGSGWQSFLALRHARIPQALGNDIPRVSLCLHLMLSVALALIMLGAQWVVVLVLTPALALLVVVGGTAGAFLALPMIRRAGRLGASSQRGKLRLLDTTGQLLGGLKLAMAQNLASAFVDEFDATQSELARQQRSFDLRRTRAQAWNSVAFAAAMALIVLGGQWLRVPAPSLVAALAVLARMAGPFFGLVRDAREIATSLPSYRGLRELEDDLPSHQPSPALVGETLATTAVPIRFEGAAFVHHGGRSPTLAPITLSIDPGDIVGIAGASGSGKTTFVDLICGLLTPSSGRLLIGDAPLTGGRLTAWRERLAYVAQDAYLFNDTVRRNLSWGRAALSDEALWQALALVDANGVVRAMPGGLDANVAERGARLSGGERQRLALARAMLRSPDLLILDEATNAVGIEAERMILTRMLAALGGATVMIVTHRPETLSFCRRVLTFGAGGLVGDERR